MQLQEIVMPKVVTKKGHTSVAISQYVLAQIDKEIKRPQIHTLGINTKAAFVDHAVSEYLLKVRRYEASFFEQRFEARNFYNDTVVIRDYFEVMDYEVVIQETPSTKEALLYCRVDNNHSCVHVGYAFSLPDILESCQKKGLRVRKHLDE